MRGNNCLYRWHVKFNRTHFLGSKRQLGGHCYVSLYLLAWLFMQEKSHICVYMTIWTGSELQKGRHQLFCLHLTRCCRYNRSYGRHTAAITEPLAQIYTYACTVGIIFVVIAPWMKLWGRHHLASYYLARLWMPVNRYHHAPSILSGYICHWGWHHFPLSNPLEPRSPSFCFISPIGAAINARKVDIIFVHLVLWPGSQRS